MKVHTLRTSSRTPKSSSGVQDPGAASAPSSQDKSAAFFGIVKRELQQRSIIEPVIGHLKAEVTSAAASSKVQSETLPKPSSPPSVTTFVRILAWRRHPPG
jgi:hypothetical protein